MKILCENHEIRIEDIPFGIRSPKSSKAESGEYEVGMPLDEALRLESRSFHDVGLSSDLAEGTTAFREKRQARFTGQ
jgi:enoyl-CoA hydratase/carnithine racemase